MQVCKMLSGQNIKAFHDNQENLLLGTFLSGYPVEVTL